MVRFRRATGADRRGRAVRRMRGAGTDRARAFRGTRVAGAWAIAIVLFQAARAYSETPEERFREAENTFRFQDYSAAEAALNALLHPVVLLKDPDMVLKAREYLGACYYWLGNERRMEEEFTALLTLAPNHRLDPFYYPADLIDRLDRLRARLAELHVIELEPRAEAPKPPCLVPKETVTRRSRWVAFVPFGVGQFHNGDPVKGSLFLTGEVLSLGANIATYVAAERLRGSDGSYSAADARRARTLRVVQYASLGVFAGLVLWGVVDAALNIHTEEHSVEMVPCPQDPVPDQPASRGDTRASICVRFWP